MTGSSAGRRALALANWLAWPVAIAGVLAFVLVAVAGLSKRPDQWMGDFYWYVAGGDCLWRGQSMYAVACFGPALARLTPVVAHSGLSYPPHFAGVALALAAVPLGVAIAFTNILNAAFAAGMVAQLARVARVARRSRAGTEGAPMLSRLWAVPIVLANAGLWSLYWLGQYSLLAALAVWLAFGRIEHGRDISAGVLLALASAKPQMAVLALFWVVLQGRVRVLASAAIAGVVLALPALLQDGAAGAIHGWARAMAGYQSYAVNALDGDSILGLPGLASHFGWTIPLWAALAAGAALLMIMRMTVTGARFSPQIVAAIVIIQLLVYGHAGDAIILAPAFGLLWPDARASAAQLLSFFVAAILYCVPLPGFVLAWMPLLGTGGVRTIVILAVAGALLWTARREQVVAERHGRAVAT